MEYPYKNRKAYILKLFICLVCADRMYCFLESKKHGDGSS